MVWRDTIGDIVTAINAQSVYNTTRSTTPSDLGLRVFNQAQDFLCMYKPGWRDLRVDTVLVLDADRKITMPLDYGCGLFCYCDPTPVGKPMYFYYLNHPDVAMRYTEETTIDSTTGVKTIKYAFPQSVILPANPHVVYSKALSSATAAEVAANTKRSFFPINVMLVAAKKILQDYYGVAANQDPNWINLRVMEEIRLLENYSYANNAPLDLTIKDRYGNPVFISGASLDGSRPRLSRPSPFLPSTLWSGGLG